MLKLIISTLILICGITLYAAADAPSNTASQIDPYCIRIATSKFYANIDEMKKRASDTGFSFELYRKIWIISTAIKECEK